MVVLHHDSVRDIVVEWYFNTFLRVQTQPFPAVDSSSSEVTRWVADAGVVDVQTAIFPRLVWGWKTLMIFRRAFFRRVHPHFSSFVGYFLASGYDTLAAWVSICVVSGTHRDIFTYGTFAARTGEIEEF